ncbi:MULTISPECIES: hypothetical protein [Pantoea]|uniref:hypothetical protein n=1 Tax=Pantoea TaxID=53335 RepID=UPI00025859A7|nr:MULTISPECIES: hypothetical protein [Pantoea]EIB96765.1 hypothetical protein S7A_19309 [Pantoea sp. Sc1]KKB02864.1 hypothetical protein TN98_17785 [Pantoea anthophila]DAL43266.1 MAG TPA_asm: hypothetical protein [Caudoviricetes sp.]
MKKFASLLFIELLFLLFCIPVGMVCAALNLSESAMGGIIVSYVFLSMALVPAINKRFILKENL